MATFVLHIQDLDESGKVWNFAMSADWLSSALEGTDLRPAERPGALRVAATQSGQDVLVQGSIDAAVVAECARCLADVDIEIGLPLTVLFSPESERPDSSAEVEVRPDELNHDYFGGTMIVLDPIVRELLLLEVPMKPLCADDCKGIAVPQHLRPPEQVFGDSAPDARFAPLLKIKEELTKKEE